VKILLIRLNIFIAFKNKMFYLERIKEQGTFGIVISI